MQNKDLKKGDTLIKRDGDGILIKEVMRQTEGMTAFLTTKISRVSTLFSAYSAILDKDNPDGLDWLLITQENSICNAKSAT